MTNSSEPLLRIPPPGSEIPVWCSSDAEHRLAWRLAAGRQRLAHERLNDRTWPELSDQEREALALEAVDWLRAADRAGLTVVGKDAQCVADDLHTPGGRA